MHWSTMPNLVSVVNTNFKLQAFRFTDSQGAFILAGTICMRSCCARVAVHIFASIYVDWILPVTLPLVTTLPLVASCILHHTSCIMHLHLSWSRNYLEQQGEVPKRSQQSQQWFARQVQEQKRHTSWSPCRVPVCNHGWSQWRLANRHQPWRLILGLKVCSYQMPHMYTCGLWGGWKDTSDGSYILRSAYCSPGELGTLSSHLQGEDTYETGHEPGMSADWAGQQIKILR